MADKQTDRNRQIICKGYRQTNVKEKETNREKDGHREQREKECEQK